MKRIFNARTTGFALIAAGVIIGVLALYADTLGLGGRDPYLGFWQWLGLALGLVIALAGLAVLDWDRIWVKSRSWLHRTWIRLVGSWPLVLMILLTVLVAGGALFLRLQNIAAALPYPGHIDEPHLSARAGQILKTGSFNLQFFNYGHTPIYLVAGGLLVGYADAAMHLEVNNTAAIGSLGFPYFSQPRVIWPAKALFASLSVVAMALMGIVGWRAFGRQALLWLVPFVVLFSASYFFYSHKYLNVDLVGAFFVAALYFALFQYLDRDTVVHKALIPGALSALVLTSKYTLLWIVVPSILAILLYSSRNQIGKILVYMLSTAIGFVLLTPDIITDLSLFVDTIAGSMFHYARGHTGSEGEPGLLQLIYYLNSIVDAYGLTTLLLAALGIVAAFIRNWKGSLVLVSFPSLLLLFMSAQSARFVRNIISVHLFYGLFVAIGVLCAYDLASRLLERYAPLRSSALVRHLILILAFVGLLALLLPVQRLIAWAQPQPDSRNLAQTWIEDNVPSGSVLFIAEELGMRTKPLEEDYQVVVEPFAKLTRDRLQARIAELGDAYILMPVFGYDVRRESGRDLAERLNELAENVEMVKSFPGTEVVVNGPQPVPQGNPNFFVGQLDLTPEQRARLRNQVGLDLPAMEGRKRITEDGTLRLPWNTTLSSPPIRLEAGEYEVVLVTKGTVAEGASALLRVYWGEGNLVGEFYAPEDYEQTKLPLALDAEEEASLIVAFVNDGVERNEAGEIVADRNALIQSIAIEPVSSPP